MFSDQTRHKNYRLLPQHPAIKINNQYQRAEETLAAFLKLYLSSMTICKRGFYNQVLEINFQYKADGEIDQYA